MHVRRSHSTLTPLTFRNQVPKGGWGKERRGWIAPALLIPVPAATTARSTPFCRFASPLRNLCKKRAATDATAVDKGRRKEKRGPTPRSLGSASLCRSLARLPGLPAAPVRRQRRHGPFGWVATCRSCPLLLFPPRRLPRPPPPLRPPHRLACAPSFLASKQPHTHHTTQLCIAHHHQQPHHSSHIFTHARRKRIHTRTHPYPRDCPPTRIDSTHPLSLLSKLPSSPYPQPPTSLLPPSHTSTPSLGTAAKRRGH